MGAGDNDSYDQELEVIHLSLKETGEAVFEIHTSSPDLYKLPSLEDVFDTTAITHIVYFKEKEFFRCSYYVTHQYANGIMPSAFTENGLMRYEKLTSEQSIRKNRQEQSCRRSSIGETTLLCRSSRTQTTRISSRL